MTESFNWTCPHCGRDTTINPDHISRQGHKFGLDNKYGPQVLHSVAIACPNPECKELTVTASLGGYRVFPNGYTLTEAREKWRLVPRASVKVFPDYVPAPVLADYREACLIRDLSAKASASLARRCLQGMIRDFWGVKKDRLIDEIEAIKDGVDPSTWKAIDAVRRIGNIGAHMEKDINLIIEVDPEEAGLLISLIETLISEWYVTRHDRDERMAAIVQAAQDKKPDAPPPENS